MSNCTSGTERGMGKVLLTGAAGGVASMLRPMLLERYGEVVLSDRIQIDDLNPGECFRPAHLNDPEAVAQSLEGVDRVIHLGGQPYEGSWEVVLQSNIIGLHTFYEGCRMAGVRRIVFASSNHAIGYYGRNRRIGVEQRVRPDSRYGVSKVFGEALSALYADKHGIGCLSVRIGNVGPKPLDTRRLSIWIHQEDMMQLCAIGLEHPDIHNQVVYGVSDNDRSWWDNCVAYKLGYRPKHNAEHYSLAAPHGDGPPDQIGDLFQGGGFCADEFDGDIDRTYRT